MTIKSNELSKAVRLALIGATVSAVAAPVAFAQDDADKLETITVIGSRIKRTDIETSQPVLVIEREDLQRTGLTSVGDILQDLAANGATLNTVFNNGGNGETRVDLRNLGSNRTLVLVNGRRWVSGLSGAVDLNTIPTSVVERIEVLKDGASAIYGSDAIGGVINITTRDNYDGAEATAYLGENEEGDGRTEAYDFTIGTTTDRGNVVMNVSYTKQEPIFAGDREISAVPFSGIPANITGSGTTPFGRFGFGAAGNRLPTGAPFNGGAGRLTYDPSVAGGYRVFGDDAYNFAPVNYLLTPQERTSLFVQGRYAITDNINFKSEVLYNERQSAQELAANPLTFGAAGSGAARFTIPANAATNPFGQDITFASFRPTNFPRHFAQDVDTFRFGGGFDGSFDLVDRSFSWDVNYIYSQNETHIRNDGQYNIARLQSGLQCTAAAAAAGSCLPLDIYHGASGFTQAMVDYAGFVAQENLQSILHNYTANITGDLFELPAGPFGFAAGYEYRSESGFDQPDSLVAAGLSTGNNRSPTQGSFSLDEFYAEFSIPILKDLPGAEILEFSLAARYSDYSTFGDTTNGKFGFRWKPFSDLLVRGNYSEGFRAPNIGELFGGQSDSFPAFQDPCSIQTGVGGVLVYTPIGTQFEAGCRAAGVPVGTYQQTNTQIRVTAGSNPNLTPENAVTKTLGLVYSPSYVEGLDFYLDWYNIKLTNTIAAFGASFIANQCALDPTQTSAFCSTIVRDVGGNIVDLLAAGVNAGEYDLEGYDFTVNYKWDTSFGKFRVNWDNAYVSKYTQEVPVGSGATSVVGNYFGGSRSPFWQLKSNIDLNWQYGDFGATAGARYFSALDEDCFNAEARGFDNLCSKPGIESPIFGGAENTLDDIWYFDLQGTWDAPWDARVTAGVNNVLDEDPPRSVSTFANSFDPQYEVPGRFWYVSYTQKF